MLSGRKDAAAHRGTLKTSHRVSQTLCPRRLPSLSQKGHLCNPGEDRDVSFHLTAIEFSAGPMANLNQKHAARVSTFRQGVSTGRSRDQRNVAEVKCVTFGLFSLPAQERGLGCNDGWALAGTRGPCRLWGQQSNNAGPAPDCPQVSPTRAWSLSQGKHSLPGLLSCPFGFLRHVYQRAS